MYNCSVCWPFSFLFLTVCSGISSSPQPLKLWPKHSSPIPQCNSWSKANALLPSSFKPLTLLVLILILIYRPLLYNFQNCILLTLCAGTLVLENYSADIYWLTYVLSTPTLLGDISLLGLCHYYLLSQCVFIVSRPFVAVYKKMLSGTKGSFFLLKLWKPTHLCVHCGWYYSHVQWQICNSWLMEFFFLLQFLFFCMLSL